MDKSALGRAYGLHRGLDTLGATVGPFLTFLLLPQVGVRGVFWLSAIPAFLAVLTFLWIREARSVKVAADSLPSLRPGYLRTLPAAYRRFLLVSSIFALALSSNAFPASLIFGFLWQSYGPELAFGVGAGLALLALLFFLLDGRRARP